MTGGWHVAHADGRRWDQAELDDLAGRLRERSGLVPYAARCQSLCVDTNGALVMIDGWGSWRYIDGDDEEDMMVVWDG